MSSAKDRSSSQKDLPIKSTFQIHRTGDNMQQSISFKTLHYARTWAYNKNFKDMMYLIEDKENKEYLFVNENKLFYYQKCFGLDLSIIEVWG
mgnify:CR=1 FL=1|jgi:hypothetical protein